MSDGSGIEVRPWRPDLDDSEASLAAVIALAKRYRQTLGFLPDTAFRDGAEVGHLLMALDGDVLVGYTLYRVTRSVIKLTHVCVDVPARGKQLGRMLIDSVVEANPSATGIVARCRRDYGLKRFWEGAGLSPSAEAAGRNAQGLPLTLWTRQLGAPDLLLSNVLGSEKPIAVLDSNIVIDLHSSDEVHRPDRRSSQALMADWLAEEVTFAVSVQLDHELDDNDDASERVRQSAGSQGWVRLPTTRPHDTTVEDTLISVFGDGVLTRDPSLTNDVKHLADAIRAHATYFVTNDGGILAAREVINEGHGVTIVRPHELITDVLAESGALQVYAPGVFEHIDLRWQPARDFDDAKLERAFLTFSEGEKARDFRPALRAALTHAGTKVLVDDSGSPLALIAEQPVGNELQVPLLRVAASQHDLSIALQLARQLRLDALAVDANQVTVTDARPSRRLAGALREDGYFRDATGSFLARPIAQRLIAREFSRNHALPGETDPQTIASGPSLWRDLEWRHWPLKLWDDETPCYVVPIRPSASMELFAYPPNLFQQRRALGLSRSHVYYRSGHNNPFQNLPARVLWYVSTEGAHSVQQFFAVSRAVASHVMVAEEAHTRFSAQGVYKRSQVTKAADKHGRVTVLEVEDTEILDRPIGLKEFRARAAGYGVIAEFVSPRTIPSDLFCTLMTEFHSLEAAT